MVQCNFNACSDPGARTEVATGQPASDDGMRTPAAAAADGTIARRRHSVPGEQTERNENWEEKSACMRRGVIVAAMFRTAAAL